MHPTNTHKHQHATLDSESHIMHRRNNNINEVITKDDLTKCYYVLADLGRLSSVEFEDLITSLPATNVHESQYGAH